MHTDDHRAARRPRPVRQDVPRLPAGRAARVHRLAAVLQRLGDEGQVPRHPQQPGVGRGRPQAVGRRAGACSTGSSSEKWLTRGRRVRAVPGQRGRRRRHRGLHRRDAAPKCARRCTSCASRPSTARACRTARWPTSSRRRRPACATTSARSRSPPASAAPSKIERVQGRARRLQRDPARVARRPAGRGVRRTAARAGPHRVLGLPARRGPRQRGADQGALRRHPPGAGLPGLPGAHREADDLGAARRRRPTPASS